MKLDELREVARAEQIQPSGGDDELVEAVAKSRSGSGGASGADVGAGPDARRLNFIYREQRSDGRPSTFFRLESPEREDA
jgi:hypothetical protein